uniref:Uncharacterized protein n=1 Tax=Ditylenchus dipsaci TaxID=166011 RepID=A0A915D9G1_9BILA
MIQLIVLPLTLPAIFAVPISRSFHELPCLIDRNCRPFFLFYFLDGTCNLKGDLYGQIANSSCSYSLNWAVFMLLFLLPLLFCPISMIVGMVIAKYKRRTKETPLEAAGDPSERVARLTSYFKTVKEEANKPRVFIQRPTSDPIIPTNHPVYVVDKPRGESPSGWSAQETTPAGEENTPAAEEHQKAAENTSPLPELYRKKEIDE